MITLTVYDKGKQFHMDCHPGESVMSALIRHGYSVSAYCGGNGTCGKCKIKVQDEYRLACQTYPVEDMSVELCMNMGGNASIVTEYVDKADQEMLREPYSEDGFGIAVDLGTTTLAIQMVKCGNGEVIASWTGLNPQKSHGADVISRIHAANAGKRELLTLEIRKILECGFRALILDSGVDAGDICEVVLSANTMMVHLLLGYPCDTLGVAPFKPYETMPQPIHVKELIPDSVLNCPVKVVPSVSAFVGGDIVSGLFACDILRQEKPVLFIDLGTNGEMAVGNKEKLLVTSVAAGPAFEGGNISCGVGSIPGAVSGVEMLYGRVVKLATIGGKTPVGMCGTGVLEAVAELLKEGIIDRTGLLAEEYFEDGFDFSGDGKVLLTQKDIREIQLAKAAVRAGIEVLLTRYGITYDAVETVYLAGGFGYYISPEKVMAIGMLPAAFKGKVKAVGNSSLGGAKRLLNENVSWEKTEEIVNAGEEIRLAMDAVFQQLYVEHMTF